MKKNQLKGHWRAEVIVTQLPVDEYVKSLFPLQEVERISVSEYLINGEFTLELHKSDYVETKVEDGYAFNQFSSDRPSHIVMNILDLPEGYLTWIYYRDELKNVTIKKEYLGKIHESTSLHAFEKLEVFMKEDETIDTMLVPAKFKQRITPYLPLTNLTTSQRETLLVRPTLEALGHDFLNFNELSGDAPIGDFGLTGDYVVYKSELPYLAFLSLSEKEFLNVKDDLFSSLKHIVLFVEDKYVFYSMSKDHQWHLDYVMNLEEYKNEDWRLLSLFHRSNFTKDEMLYDEQKLQTLSKTLVNEKVKEATEYHLLWLTNVYGGDVKQASVDVLQMVKKHLRTLVRDVESEMSFKDLEGVIEDMQIQIEQKEALEPEQEQEMEPGQELKLEDEVMQKKPLAIQFDEDSDRTDEELETFFKKKNECKEYFILGLRYVCQFKSEVLASSIRQLLLLRPNKLEQVYVFAEMFGKGEFVKDMEMIDRESIHIADDLLLLTDFPEERYEQLIEDLKVFFELDSSDIHQNS